MKTVFKTIGLRKIILRGILVFILLIGVTSVVWASGNDINNDGRVDKDDLVLVIASWLKKDSGLIEDVNLDERINAIDAGYVLTDLNHEGLRIQVNQDLDLSISTYLNNDPGDLSFFVMKKNPPNSRSERFGFAGVQGLWDTQPYHVNFYNDYYEVEKTGEEYLEKHLAMIEALGVKWIGMDFTWSVANPKPDVFNWSRFDMVFEMAKKYNLQIVPMLVYTPCWVNAVDECNCDTNKCSCYGSNTDCSGPGLSCRWSSAQTCCEPMDLSSLGSDRFNTFVSEVVKRYKSFGEKNSTSEYGISNWVVWNETDHIFWKQCQNDTYGSMESYCNLLKGAYQTIKGEDSEAKVLISGLTHLDPVDKLNELEEFCGTNYFDIYNVHYYKSKSSLDSFVNNFGDARDDDTLDIWVTEIGWPWDLDESNKKLHLESVFDTLENLETIGVDKVLWWDSRGYFAGDNPETAWSRSAAVFDANYYPFPSYFTFGEWLETIIYKGEVSAEVIANKIEISIPGSYFDEVGDYVVIYASESKMITALPLKVKVIE
jgi:glycosyl hydrolase family 42 (putative beta-galactosidase)